MRLTSYGGEGTDLAAEVMQGYLDKIATGKLTVGAANVYRFDDIRKAHDDMEHNRAVGKLVVITSSGDAVHRSP